MKICSINFGTYSKDRIVQDLFDAISALRKSDFHSFDIVQENGMVSINSRKETLEEKVFRLETENKKLLEDIKTYEQICESKQSKPITSPILFTKRCPTCCKDVDNPCRSFNCGFNKAHAREATQ